MTIMELATVGDLVGGVPSGPSCACGAPFAPSLRGRIPSPAVDVTRRRSGRHDVH